MTADPEGVVRELFDAVDRLDFERAQGGANHHVSAPSSFVLRRDGDTWKIVLIHSIPVS